MGTNSISALIFDAIQSAGKPLRYVEIRSYVKKHYPYPTNDGSLRTVLSLVVKEGIVKKVKFPNRSSFYGKPDWFDEKGQVKPEINFNPYFNLQR